MADAPTPEPLRSEAEPRRRRGVALVLALGVALQATLLWLGSSPSPRRPQGDEVTYRAAAVALVRGEAIEPALIWPPGYAWFLRLLGGDRTSLPVYLVQMGLLAVALVALARFAERGLELAGAGRVAAAFLLVYPPFVAFAHQLRPEILHLALMLSALALLAGGVGRWRLFAGGLLLGLALLTKSLLQPFVPVVAVAAVLARPAPRPWRRLGWLALGLGLAVGPVVVDHAQRYGRPVIAASGWFNAWVGLNDRSPRNLVDEIVTDELATYLASAPDSAGRDRVARAKIRGLVRERGAMRVLGDQLGRQYFRLFDKSSYLTDMLPGGPQAKAGRGYAHAPPWLVALLSGWSHVAYAVLLVLAAGGLVLVPLRGRPWRLAMVGFLAYNLAIFLVLHVKTRYRVQLEPVLAVWAAAAVVDRRGLLARAREPRFALAWLLLAGTVLWLAFGGAAGTR